MTIETSDVIRYLKILLISLGAVSVSMAMKAGVPVLVHDLSAVWTGFTACLKPLYLYVAINVIIVAIVLASRFQRESGEDEMMQLHPREFRRLLVTARTPPAPESVEDEMMQQHPREFWRLLVTARTPPAPDLNRLVAVAQLELKPDFEPETEVNGSIVAVNEDDVGDSDGEYCNFAVAPPLGDESRLFRWAAAEKLLADQKPPPKAGLEGLRIPARPKQHETLENTWRMITEKNHLVTPARQLRRSDWFENASADENENHAPHPRPQNRDALKSRTFKDRTNYDSPKAAPVKARKEPSLSQDELNRRVEAFINKFNEEMRLQREQSIQQHMEMINRGAY